MPGIGVDAAVEQAHEHAHVAGDCGGAQRPRRVLEAQRGARALQKLGRGAVALGQGVLQRRVAPPVGGSGFAGSFHLRSGACAYACARDAPLPG